MVGISYSTLASFPLKLGNISQNTIDLIIIPRILCKDRDWLRADHFHNSHV